ncbi:MAG: 4Fe-4S cluster-binding domain-containing protein, partial [Actinobacteria bacterium]|nr:4Fe-4S cluster-binding domain-containing protein [Actinomycetota bacterium]
MSVVDGPGLRAVVWAQGCAHCCPGCHNPETWDFAGGKEWT